MSRTRIAFRVTRSYGRTPWGVFTNLWPTAESRRDREGGYWYCHLHTPRWVVEIHPVAVED